MESNVKRILFIGNSYTFYNDMPIGIFAKMAKSCGLDITVETVTSGGYTLLRHSDPDDAVGGDTVSALKENDYDVVILQEQSHTPVTAPDAFRDGAEKLVELARARGAKILFYSTWGRKKGSVILEQYGLTTESMTYGLAASYENTAKAFGAEVAHVGLAFYYVYENYPDVCLYSRDLSHPSYAGSYLAALTIFIKIFGITAENVPFVGETGDWEIDVLRDAAARAVSGKLGIPEKYQKK